MTQFLEIKSELISVMTEVFGGGLYTELRLY